MIEYRTAGGRFVTRAEGRTTWHSFSFGAHYDPRNVGFGQLVAHNDERLPPGTGYDDHPHVDLEIVTWVLSGALRHTSSVGSGVIGPGQVQRLSAGRGVVHSEVADGSEETRFLQAWVRPDEPGLEPGYVTDGMELGHGWSTIAGPGGVPLASAGTTLQVTRLGAGERLDLPDARSLHVFVAAGAVMLGERLLEPDDAARLLDEPGRAITAESQSQSQSGSEAQVLVWSFSQ